MPLSTRRRIIAAKNETTPGTAISIANGDVLFYATEGNIVDNAEFTPLYAGGSLSQATAQLGLEPGQHTFKTTLYQAAPWGPILMPAIGFVDNVGDLSGTSWQPSDDPTDWEWNTSAQNIGGKLKKIAGALGSAVINIVAGQVPTVDWTFTGRYEAEADATQWTPAYNIITEPAAGAKIASGTITLGGSSICFATATIAINNTVELILCQTAAGGILYAWITNREITLTIDPMEELVATRNDDGILRAKTLQAFAWAFGNMSISMPKCQLRQIAPGERNGLSARTLTFHGTINSAAGDEFVLDLDTTD